MKSIIVFYSHSGNTRKIAEMIAAATAGDVCEIIPQDAYPIDYDMVVKQAKKELQIGFHPEIINDMPDMSVYDTVFIGTPNWWSSIAPPVVSFIEQVDLTGKTIVPFCSNGGGGLGKIDEELQQLIHDAVIKPGYSIYGSSIKRGQIDNWIKELKL